MDNNNPDAPGYFVEYLYKKFPVYVYCFKENCYDIGTLDALHKVKSLYFK